MKKLFFLSLFLLAGCASFPQPQRLTYETVDGGDFKVAAWSKITQKGAPLRLYVEGDGFAWRNRYTPSLDPTPRKPMLLNLADADDAANVAYLARPCQYVFSDKCDVPYWTIERFAPEIVDAVLNAAKMFVKRAQAKQVTVIGYSGGGVVSGWLAAHLPQTAKWITLAGVVDDAAWTAYHGDTPLERSVPLRAMTAKLSKIPQIHYVGAKDTVVPPSLIEKFVGSYGDSSNVGIVVVPDAAHTTGWTPDILR